MKQELVTEMISLLVDEFNCNHQADLESSNKVEIYAREKEQILIKRFISDNMTHKKAGLLYLCGHPGTGKTSTLNLILSEMKYNGHSSDANPMEILLYNAMTFSDVKSFGLQLIEDFSLQLTGESSRLKLSKTKCDDEEIA